MLSETDLLGECLKDLCAAHARLFQELALVAKEGETKLLRRLQIVEADKEFHHLRAARAETETAELLGAALELFQMPRLCARTCLITRSLIQHCNE